MAVNGNAFGPVQVIPPGLLGFLQLKNAGVNPEQLEKAIRVVWDAQEWYFESRMEVIRSALVNTAAGPLNGNQPLADLTVPQDEYWWVQNISVYGSVGSPLGAGDVVRMLVTYVMPQFGNDPFAIEQPLGQAFGQGDTPLISASGFFVPSGAVLGFYFVRYAQALGNQFRAICRFTRLPI